MFKLEDCVAYLASRQTKKLAAELEKRILPFGITRVQWMALYYTEKNPDITQKQLAELLGVREPTVVGLIDRMEADDLVIRETHPENRRIRTIALTEKGKKLNCEVSAIAEQLKDDAIEGIPGEDLETFRRVLDEMVNNTCRKA